MNSVSAVGAGMNGENSKPNKKSNLGAKIGAGVGVAIGAVRAFKKREMINQLGDSLILAGQSRAVANISKVAGVAVGIGLLAAVGSLVGKGVEKLINHLKKDEPKGVLPGGDPNKKPEVEGDPFEKYRKAPQDLTRNVKTKDGEEYVIQDGHPKVIYKKDNKTGKLTYQSAVYDGSWGKEMSDDDLIASMKETEKLAKMKKEGHTTFVNSDGKVSYVKQ